MGAELIPVDMRTNVDHMTELSFRDFTNTPNNERHHLLYKNEAVRVASLSSNQRTGPLQCSELKGRIWTMSATGIRGVYSVLDIRAGGSSQRAADGSADLSTTQQLSSSIFLLVLQTTGGMSHAEWDSLWQFVHCIASWTYAWVYGREERNVYKTLKGR